MSIWKLLQTDFKYEGYAARQSEQNQRLDRKQNQKIPDGLDYDKIAGLRSETKTEVIKIETYFPGPSGAYQRNHSIRHFYSTHLA